MSLLSHREDLADEREQAARAIERDVRLRAIIEDARNLDGNYELKGDLRDHFQQVATKTVQGVFYGLYGRFVPRAEVTLTRVADRRLVTPEELAGELRPSPLRDITDGPFPEITPSGWAVRDPLIFLTFRPLDGGEPIERACRLVRQPPVEWIQYQPTFFQFGFVKGDDGRALCIIDLWETLLIAASAPWPDRRGPLRRRRGSSASSRSREYRTVEPDE